MLNEYGYPTIDLNAAWFVWIVNIGVLADPFIISLKFAKNSTPFVLIDTFGQSIVMLSITVVIKSGHWVATHQPATSKARSGCWYCDLSR